MPHGQVHALCLPHILYLTPLEVVAPFLPFWELQAPDTLSGTKEQGSPQNHGWYHNDQQGLPWVHQYPSELRPQEWTWVFPGTNWEC